MSPEERLEALRDDARWQPITLYPEHGRMPAPVRPQPWRAIVGTAIVLAVVAVVFSGVSAVRSLGNNAAPMPIAGTTGTVSPAPRAVKLPDDLAPAQLLAMAKLPTNASAVSSEVRPEDFPEAGSCGLASTGTAFWSESEMGITAVESWLNDNPTPGMKAVVDIPSPVNAIDVGAYVIEAVDDASSQGLAYTLIANGSDGVKIRVDAVSLPQGAACVSATERTAAEKAASNAAAFAAAQAAQPDAAARQRAQQWADSAVVPPGATASTTEPTANLNSEGPTSWWCAPEAAVTRYWTLSGMSVDDAANWLREHPTPGLVVANPGTPPAGAVPSTIADVVEQPNLTAVEGLDFTVAQNGDGVAIRAVASALSATHTCLDPGPGAQYAVGG